MMIAFILFPYWQARPCPLHKRIFIYIPHMDPAGSLRARTSQFFTPIPNNTCDLVSENGGKYTYFGPALHPFPYFIGNTTVDLNIFRFN